MKEGLNENQNCNNRAIKERKKKTDKAKLVFLKSHIVAESVLVKENKEKFAESRGKDFEKLVLKPVERQGERNIYCPYYSLCLDHAVQKGWQYWDCAECPKKMVRRPLEGCGDIPTQTFEYHDLLQINTDLF